MNILSKKKIRTLSKKDEIKQVLDKGKKVYFRFGLIFLFNEENQNHLRVGILVKKSCGNAVKRNYIKRICRAFVRNYSYLFKNTNRVIFLFNKNCQIKYKDLEKEIFRFLEKNEKNIFADH